MSKETTDAGKQGNWRLLLAALVSNIAALAHLEPLRAQLAAQLDKLVEVHNQQAGLIASKQDMSKQLRTIVIEGDRLATLLRSAVKQHYGIRSEKVAEFGVQPFRGKARKVTPEPEPPTAPSPPVPAATK
ncbi:MAG: hypothetical protein WAM82_31875 [Thermoanaerobaculia bacterium]